jgi:hypothetical protein
VYIVVMLYYLGNNKKKVLYVFSTDNNVFEHF